VTRCMYTFVHMVQVVLFRVIFTEISLLSQLPQKPVLSLSILPFFEKDGHRWETVHLDADETIITRPG